jgi:hypothetical protein
LANPEPYTSSNLSVVSIPAGDEDTAWDKIRTACPFLTDWGTEILRQGLNGHVKAVLIEPHYICKDFRNLFSQFYSKKFLDRPSHCSRLHFFNADVSLDEAMEHTDAAKEAYIGYTVVQPVRERCLGRTYIDPFGVGKAQGNVYCLRTASKVHLNGVEYVVKGYPYHSQSKEATVCAHAALWGVCRYLSDRYHSYAELHPYDLIERTGDESGRRVPYRGMTWADYSQILASFGCHPVVIKPRTDQTTWAQDIGAFHDIYSYVESGFPVLVSFKGHVAVLIGHTVGDSVGIHAKDQILRNGVLSDTRFYNSFALVKQFVVVDDNFFPYTLLGYPTDAQNYGKAFTRQLNPVPSIDSIFAAVVPLPEKAFLPADKARTLGYRYFEHRDAAPLIDSSLVDLKVPSGEPLIARLFLTTASSFKARKRLCGSGPLGGSADVLALLPVDLNLPHCVWVMEISPLSLYKDGFCVGEVVLDASASEDECDYIYMRIGKTVFRGGQQKTNNAGLMRFCQYTHNLGERDA